MQQGEQVLLAASVSTQQRGSILLVVQFYELVEVLAYQVRPCQFLSQQPAHGLKPNNQC